MIQSKDVVSIIDYSLLSSSSIVEEMVFNQRKNKRVIETEENAAKSIVITIDYIYFSPLSVYTLKKRANMMSTLNRIEDYTDESEV